MNFISELSISLDFDEDAAVDAVVQKMLQKKVVPKKVYSDLGLDSSKKQVDPRVKMELRRKQVCGFCIKFFHYHHHHQVAMTALISLTFSCYPSLSSLFPAGSLNYF